MQTNYPQYRNHLMGLIGAMRQRMPGPMAAFGKLHEETMKKGALGVRHKELIALGIAIADRCDACISFHVHEALTNGASVEELEECIAVAILMGGGPSVMYGAHAQEAIAQFRAAEC